MKITSPWRRNNNNRNKKKLVTSKPKIAWEQLGLKSRKAADTSMSIEEIRRRVIQASNQALGKDLESHPMAEGARSSSGGKREETPPKTASRGNTASDRVGTSAQRANR